MSQCAIAYLRVSTERQGRSGLGIEAQRARVAQFAESEGFALIGEEVEIGTGKPSNNAACFIEKRQPKMTTLMGQSLR